MVINDFKAFATEENANVLSQEEYESLDALGEGFQSGIARSEQLNKVWRQATTIAAIVAQFMADKAGEDVLDDGNLDNLRVTLVKALLNNATSQLDSRYLKTVSNLSDVSNAATARGNLGLKGAAVQDVGTVAGTVAAGNDSRIVNALQRGNNLSDLLDKAAARRNLGLKGAALTDVGTSAGTVAAGNDSRIINAIQRGNNLSDLPDKAVTRINLGLKGAALADIGTVAGTVAAGNDGRIVNAIQRGNNLSELTNKATALTNLNGVPKTTTVNGKTLTGNINVTSQDIFNTQAVSIPSGGNLNNYQTPGLYYQSTNVWAQAGSNYPEALAGALIVLKSAGVTQMYIVYNTSRVYTRSLYGSSIWTPWAKEYNSLNKPTAADVGALSLSGGNMSGTINGVYKGPFAFVQQYDSKAPFYEDYSTSGTSEYHPVIK